MPNPFWFGEGGAPVTPETAVYFTAVYGCVKIISETLASLPLIVYKRTKDGGKERATKHPLYTLLRTKPNNLKTTGLELREMLTAHTLLWGNGYAQIIKNRMGDPLEIHPLHPSCVTPEINDNRQVVYKVRAAGGRVVYLPGDQVFHLRGYRDSGLEGMSPIAAAKKAIEMGMSLESFGTNFFDGGAFPAGVLEYEQGALSEPAKENLRTSWQKLYGGENRGKKVAVLEAGLKWKPMGTPQTDAQFLEQRRFQIEEIARIYRVPPHMLADLSRATFSNIEQMSLEFITYCMLPWFKRWEEAITRDFLDGDDSEYFTEFLVDGILRGDTLARNQSYAVGRQWGYLSINDVRKMENMNPIGEEGDQYLTPMNMTPAGENETEEKPDPKEQEEEKAKRAFSEPLKETWKRIVRKEIGSIKTAAKKIQDGGFEKWCEKFLGEQIEFARECLKPLVDGYSVMRDSESDTLLASVVSNYRNEVATEIATWRLDPSKGYDRNEDSVAERMTRETLNYATAA